MSATNVARAGKRGNICVGSRPVDRGAIPLRMFFSSASNTRLSADNNLSGDGKEGIETVFGFDIS